MKIKRIHSEGIEFSYNGDYLCYLWPWNRQGDYKRKYYSVFSEGRFKSLKDVDLFWVEFENKLADIIKKQTFPAHIIDNLVHTEPF